MNLKKILSVVLIASAVIFATTTIFRNPYSADSYLHLASGRFVLENRRLPTHQDFSFKKVSPALEYIPHSWLSDSIFYVADASRLPYALPSLLILILGIICFGLYRILQLLDIQKDIVLISLCLSLLPILSFWKVHPLVFACLNLVWIMYLYLAWAAQNSRSILYMPLLFIIYANTSGGFVGIPIVLMLLLMVHQGLLIGLGKFIPNVLKIKKSYRLFYISSVLSILATYINPLGLLIHIYSLSSISVISFRSKIFSTLIGSLKILNQNFIKETPTTLFYSIFLLFVVTLIIHTAILTLRHGKKYFIFVVELVPLLISFLLPFQWIRFIPIATICTLPLFATNLNRSLDLLKSSSKKRLATLSLFLIFILIYEFLLFNPPKFYNLHKPDEQIRMLTSIDVSNNVLTSPDLTGYLLYKRGLHVFLDAQDDLYDENENIHFFVYEPQISKENLAKIVDQHNISALLINKDYGQLPTLLGRLPEWSLLYFDYSGYLYADTELLKIANYSKHVLNYIDFSRNLGFDPKEATPSAQELVRFTKKYSDNIMAKGQLATIYRIQNKFDEAIALLENIPQEKKNYIVYTELGRAYAASGDCKTAEQMFLSALADRRETNYARATLDLAVLYAICLNDPKNAEKYYERYNSFTLSPAERDYVRTMMDKFGIKLDE